jgi:hypothetical protein
VITWPGSHKAKHLANNPYVSLACPAPHYATIAHKYFGVVAIYAVADRAGRAWIRKHDLAARRRLTPTKQATCGRILPMQQISTTYSKRSMLLLTLMAWLSMLGFDFFLHAGLLAGLYLQPSPFLLSPLTAFRLIPVGYLSFLLLAVLLAWLMIRLKLTGWRAGAIFGLELGGLAWGAFILGLLSISTASFSLLLGWFIGQTLEMAIAGAVVGSGLAGVHVRRLFGQVIVFVLLSIIITMILQTSGVVPTIRVE